MLVALSLHLKNTRKFHQTQGSSRISRQTFSLSSIRYISFLGECFNLGEVFFAKFPLNKKVDIVGKGATGKILFKSSQILAGYSHRI